MDSGKLTAISIRAICTNLMFSQFPSGFRPEGRQSPCIYRATAATCCRTESSQQSAPLSVESEPSAQSLQRIDRVNRHGAAAGSVGQLL